MKKILFQYLYLQQLEEATALLFTQGRDNDFLKNLLKIIEENLDSALTVRFLASNMAISKSTLNRKLSALTGLTPNELIRQYRLKKGAIFLVSGKNVSETAYLTGFESPSYFTQCFKEFYKVTRKKYSKNNSLIPLNGQPFP